MEQEKLLDDNWCYNCNSKYTLIKTSENHYLCMSCGYITKTK